MRGKPLLAIALLAGGLPGDPPDLAVLHDDVVRLADVDAEERSPDPAGADDGARCGRVDAGGVLPEVPAFPPVDVETFDRHVRRPHADDAPGTGAEKEGVPAAHETDGAVEDEVALVRSRRDVYRPSRRRGVHELLERRGFVRRRASLEGPGDHGSHLVGARGEREREEERGSRRKSHVRPRSSASRATRSREPGPGRASRERGCRSPPGDRRRPRSSRAACRRRAGA